MLTADPIEGDEHRVSTTLPELARWVRSGDEVFLADGAIVLCVDDDRRRRRRLPRRARRHVALAQGHARAARRRARRAVHRSRRGRARDGGAHQGRLRRVSRSCAGPKTSKPCAPACPKRGSRPHLVAKIETAVALDHLAGIVATADAVMVARGDLGIQVPARRVPLIQKEIIRFCNMAGQAGDHRDADARVDDALAAADARRGERRRQRGDRRHRRAHAVGGDRGRRLSRPTPCARWPTSPKPPSAGRGARIDPAGAAAANDDDRVAWAVAHAAVQAAEDLGVAAIVCPTQSGTTARRVAAFRPSVPIVGMLRPAEALGGLALVWGVRPLAVDAVRRRSSQLDDALHAARDARASSHAATSSPSCSASPGKRAGSTDTVRVVRA